jgi:hypothetical protein
VGTHREPRVWAQRLPFNIGLCAISVGSVGAGEHQQRRGAQRPGRRCARTGSCHDDPPVIRLVHDPIARIVVVVVGLREAYGTSSRLDFRSLSDGDDGDVLFGTQHGRQPASLAIIHVVRGRRKGGRGKVGGSARRRLSGRGRNAGVDPEHEACSRYAAAAATTATETLAHIVGTTATIAVEQGSAAALARYANSTRGCA